MNHLLVILVVLLFSVPTFAQNMGNGNEGGGGDELVVEFIRVAHALINEPAIEPSHQELLKKALDSSRIIVVTALKNPVTGLEVPDQETLIAWGSPKLIQLKKDSWRTKLTNGEAVAHFVFHELFRASGILNEQGLSPDEAFQLSVEKYKLNRFFIESEDNCTDTSKYILEAFVLREVSRDYGIQAQIKIGSEIFSTNVFGKMECFYEFMYSITVLTDEGSYRNLVGTSIFNHKFYRPRPDSIIEVE